MLKSKFNFTQKKLDEVPLPEQGKRTTYRDEKKSGLVLIVYPTGRKVYQLYKKFQGRPVRVTLGTFPEMGVEEARREATIKDGELAKGTNPNVEKHKIRNELSFGELFDQYMERYAKLHKKSWKYDEREVNKFLSHWFNRKINSIEKYEIVRLQERIFKENGLYQANRILERIRAIYNKAIEWGWEGQNPTSNIKKYKEKARDRFILPNELPLLMDALHIEENQTAKDYLIMSLMTGARKSNLLQMRWEDIRWEQSTWYIPETKNGDAITLPLIPQAMEILHRRKATATNKWVFEGDGASGHMADPKKSWDRVRQRATIELWKQTPEYAELIDEVKSEIDNANNYVYSTLKLFKSIQKRAEEKGIELPIGLTDLRIHDLRRTFGSYQAINGASLHIIGKTLGHRSSMSTQVYAHLHDDPIRSSMEQAANTIFEALEDE